MKKNYLIFAILVASLIGPAPVQIASAVGGVPLAATLTGAAEVPPADPDGTGFALIRLNYGQGTVCWELTVSNIEPATAAHIHSAAKGVNGPVVIPLTPPTSGSSSGCRSVNQDLIKAIIQHPELYYVNVHNAPYPAGAIRGQLAHIEDED